MKVNGVLVHQVRTFSFEADNGNKVEGLILNYLEDQAETNENKGSVSVSVNGDISLFQEVKEVPGFYDLDLSVVSKKGKASLKLDNLSHVGKVEMKQLAVQK